MPTGIFHKEFEVVWHDAGQNDFIIFTTTPGLYFAYFPYSSLISMAMASVF